MFEPINKYYELVKNEPWLERAEILAYEAGDVLEQAKYLSWADEGKLPENEKQVLRGRLKSNLMDALAQAWTLCRLTGEDPNEWLALGCEKAFIATTKRKEGTLHEHTEHKW